MALISVRDLNITYTTDQGKIQAINSLSFDVQEGQVLGVVGESGSGKTQTGLAILGLLPENATVSGRILFNGIDILALSQREVRHWRSTQMAMIFQDPMDCLNPYLTIGSQLCEVLIYHKGMNKKEACVQALRMFERVKINDAPRRIQQYPHEFSGGMRQRVMIAMALLCGPKLLIADEPTTALDVTVQRQLIELLKELRKEFNMTLLFISHDLGIVASLCHQIMVMKLGEKVEYGEREQVFFNPQHPYTQKLLSSIPTLPPNTYHETSTSISI